MRSFISRSDFEYLKDRSLLITGGTGSLGEALIEKILSETKIRRLAIFSRDELKQFNLRKRFSDDSRLRWFIGDVRDLARLERAFHGVDFVIHAAALKQVDTGEYNPQEFVKTNVLGSQNVIDASISANVEKVIALSTDKASSPINLYGATKLTADKLFLGANNYSFNYGTVFSVVRYGNVLGSRGSVIPFFRELAKNGQPLPITDFRMTRFWITINQATNFVLSSLYAMRGGELFVPRIPSMKIVDLATVISPSRNFIEVGMRPGEKLHEEMISADDSRRTLILRDRLLVKPLMPMWDYREPSGKEMDAQMAYQSNTNDEWMTASDLEELL